MNKEQLPHSQATIDINYIRRITIISLILITVAFLAYYYTDTVRVVAFFASLFLLGVFSVICSIAPILGQAFYWLIGKNFIVPWIQTIPESKNEILTNTANGVFYAFLAFSGLISLYIIHLSLKPLGRASLVAYYKCARTFFTIFRLILAARRDKWRKIISIASSRVQYLSAIDVEHIKKLRATINVTDDYREFVDFFGLGPEKARAYFLGIMHYYIGVAHMLEEEVEQALEHLQASRVALETDIDENESDLADTYLALGTANWITDRYDEAATWLHKSLPLVERHSRSQLVDLCNYIADTY